MEWIKVNEQKLKLPGPSEIIRPSLGEVACGLFGITEDYEEDYLSLDQYMVRNRESTFYIRARGDSMAPGINPGDVLVVDRSVKPSHGAIIALTLDGQRFCKRLSQQGGKVALLSDNSKYKPIAITEEREFTIFGVVVGIVRKVVK